MNVKEVAQLTGLSHQAVYKKIKSNKLNLDTLKDKTTGHFTSEGEAIIRDLFGLSDEHEPAATAVENELTELKIECNRLRNQVENLETRVSELTGERDYLRAALASSLSKIPNAPAVPAGDPPGEHRRGLRWLFSRKRGENDDQ